MPPPKSQKLLSQAAAESPAVPDPLDTVKVYKPDEEIPVKRVKCYNDFVAILQFRIESSVLVAGNNFKNEGLVVGTGPGMPDGKGGRTASQLNIGDVVTFYGNPVTALEPKTGVYAGQRIIIVTERAVICGLNPAPFKIVDDVPQVS